MKFDKDCRATHVITFITTSPFMTFAFVSSLLLCLIYNWSDVIMTREKSVKYSIYDKENR